MSEAGPSSSSSVPSSPATSSPAVRRAHAAYCAAMRAAYRQIGTYRDLRAAALAARLELDRTLAERAA